MDSRELKQYESWKEEVQCLRARNQHLERELLTYRPAWYHASQRISVLEQRVQTLAAENKRLKQQVQELTATAKACPPAAQSVTPDFKPSVRRRRRAPGRKKGHAAALREAPDHIDEHQKVPLPGDSVGHEFCPCCNAQLTDLKDHQRLVEDIVPAKVKVTCYHTRSGWCPHCKHRVESRAVDQPPAANVPHGQLGLNALATGVLLRVRHRLPFRQVAQVLSDLSGISISAGALARQTQRIAGWLEGDYEKLLLELRSSPQIYADETGWRTGGKNGNLWVITSPTATAYHVDKSRGGKVIQKLLGEAFGGTLVSDFYSAYSTMDCKKQKCNTHLLRELVTCAEKSPEFAQSSFHRKSKRLIKEMLLLKGRWKKLGTRRYLSRVDRLEKRLGDLAQGNYEHPDARRIAARMAKHQSELTAFLRDKDLEGTNNAAERAIRPAVVARKISGGSRSKKGADAWAKLASLMRTAGQRSKEILGTIKSLMTGAWAPKPPATA